jgi:hypothetical protein
MHEISDIATDPTLHWYQHTGPAGAEFTKKGNPVRYGVVGERDGVKIQVWVEPGGKGIVSGYPVS